MQNAEVSEKGDTKMREVPLPPGVFAQECVRPSKYRSYKELDFEKSAQVIEKKGRVFRVVWQNVKKTGGGVRLRDSAEK